MKLSFSYSVNNIKFNLIIYAIQKKIKKVFILNLETADE